MDSFKLYFIDLAVGRNIWDKISATEFILKLICDRVDMGSIKSRF